MALGCGSIGLVDAASDAGRPFLFLKLAMRDFTMSAESIVLPGSESRRRGPLGSCRSMPCCGFDMFWIVGADSLVEALHKVSDNRVRLRFGHIS